MSDTVRAALVAFLAALLITTATGVVAGELKDQSTHPDTPSVPLFVEEAWTGVDHAYEGSWEFFTGGGVAVLDCDDDGLGDLYFAGGSEPAGLYRNTSDPGGPLSFRRFESDVTDLTEVTGAYAIDIDSDELVDMAVMRRGENVLLRGLGECAFERANEAWGFDGDDDWSTAFSAKWQAGDALPTLAVGDYLTIVEAGQTPECDENALFRPRADGFTEPEVIAGHCTLSMLFSDWDRSGDRDLRVSNDRQYYRPGEGEEQLWRVAANAPARAYTREDGWESLSVFGMGIAGADINDDGYPEYFITTMAGNRLRILADGSDQPTYKDGAYARGLDVAQPFAGDDGLPSTAWHAEWDDVNNDGRLDLYVAKGNVEKMPDHAAADPSNLLIGQPDGTWAEGAIEAGIVHFDRNRGAALVDLNLDGLLDLIEVARAAPVRIWRNAGAGTATEPAPMGHWLAVELAQDGPNADAIGAWIEVKAETGIQTREVTIGGGHVSGQLGPMHFGLGDVERPGVRVTWPDGEVGEWLPVAADQRIRITRGGGDPVILPSATTMTGALGIVRESPEGPALPPVEPVDPATCVRTADDGKSVARLWDEALLDAIRRDFPAPTVHARNLYHASAAMWDAWTVYDPVGDGVFVTEKVEHPDPAAARDEAVAYAAYRVLTHRYRDSAGGPESLHQFDELMVALCYPWERTGTAGDSPAALGNRIAEHIIGSSLDDGSLEAEGYKTRDYVAVNEPMIVQQPGTFLDHPNRWQPLALEISYSQNGQLLPIGPQEFIGPHWGDVTSFAMPEPEIPGLPLDPGEPPHLGDLTTDAEFKEKAVEVVRYSSLLDPRDGVMVDISPATRGNAPLGTNDMAGYEVNPLTGEPYEPVLVPRADFFRVLAEFWADGPDSETPPGHWNTLANTVADSPGFERRIGGIGEEVDALEWDVKTYLALNGAVHDAAIAAWGAKGHYDYVRPISMIRWMGGLGQSTDPDLPSYHSDGLPLIEGEVELVTAESAAAGERHEHLADHVGEIAILAWSGNPGDTETELGGVDWIRAVEWVPYQLSTFVTPSFAAYVSGHSTFSRAAAEVLTEMTGTPYFPGGLGSWTVPAGSLEFELGPSEDVELQWATYYDASDQAGISRIYGGIHVEADDLRGRVMGARIGQDAWTTATSYWDGSARDLAHLSVGICLTRRRPFVTAPRFDWQARIARLGPESAVCVPASHKAWWCGRSCD